MNRHFTIHVVVIWMIKSKLDVVIVHNHLGNVLRHDVGCEFPVNLIRKYLL